ncbi:hypothetical protein D918_06446 [Trichuris suis]|nr:hypothetical protein D918_06446 [Trichuris suis]
MGNRHATAAAAGTVDGKKNGHRSAVVVVPIGANDQVDLAVGNDGEKKKKKGTMLRQRSLASPGKNQKRRKRLRLQSKASSPMPRSDLSSGTSRQVFVPQYHMNGLNQQHLFYPHPMNSCYYPPGAMWQQMPSPWLPKGYGMPLEPHSFFPTGHYQRWEKMMPAPPRSQSVEALCDQPTLRRHTSSVDFSHAKTSTPLQRTIGESPSEPGGRLFKFSTCLRPHLADALPKSQDRPPSATSGRSVFVEELDFDAVDSAAPPLEHKAKIPSTVTNGLKNSKEAQEKALVVTMDAQTIMERNARLLADAEKMERVSDQSKQLSTEEAKSMDTAQIGQALHREQSLNDLGPYPLVNGSKVPCDGRINGNVQSPAKQLYFGSSDDQSDWFRSVTVENGRRSVEQGEMDQSATDGQTPTMDVHSEIDFSWIADLENRLDRSSDQTSRARKSSIDTSSISVSTVGGQQNRMTTSMTNFWSRDDSIVPAANSGLSKVVK